MSGLLNTNVYGCDDHVRKLLLSTMSKRIYI